MSLIGFHVVPEHVARNPVARAMAKRRMDAQWRDHAIRIHTMIDGEDARGDIQVTSFLLAVAMKALEFEGKTESADGRVITGGMGALRDMAVTGNVWRTRHRNSVDVAMQRAKEVFDKSPPVVTQKAYMAVKEMG